MPATTIGQETLRQARRLEIRARRRVDAVFAGEYQSAFRGRGVEFDEVREHQPGDDARDIDWNVTARMGRPFVKRFIEERELTLMFAVDLSASTRFGTTMQTKQETMAELVAALSIAAARKNDRAGLLLFTDRIERFIAPAKGRSQALRLIREVLAAEPIGIGTNIADALDHLMRVQRRRSIVFVISDFLDADFDRAFRLASRRHDLIALRVRDPLEKRLPDAALLRLCDIETGRTRTIDAGSARVRRTFAEQAEGEQTDFERRMTRMGVDQATIVSGQPSAPALRRLFRQRERRR